MKRLIVAILKFIIDKVKRNKFIQNVFESPFDLNKFSKMGVFKDNNGFKHQLYDGLRSKIKPGWERLTSDKKKRPSDVNIDKLKSNSYIYIEKLELTLNTYGKTIKGAEILEVGCHAGATAFAMAEEGAKKVIGTEFNGYKVSSLSADSLATSSKLVEVNQYLKSLRRSLEKVYLTKNNISFFDDNICNTTLKPNSFDIICSWEVLEHLENPKKAFQTISNLLKPEGISIHYYNPFFCLNGGHSMCTLDFLWGHVRLSKEDFAKYIKEFRPDEEEKALSFYENGVNRMTIKDLEDILNETDMKTLGIIPFTKEQHLRMVDEYILRQVKNIYTNLELLDLIAPSVLVITQKK